MTVRDELLRADAVAEELAVSTSTLADWRKRGIGPRYLSPAPGTRWVRYRRSDVEAWQAARLVGASQSSPTAQTQGSRVRSGDTNPTNQ